MKILSKISEEVVPLSGQQHIVLLVIVACIFQFALFYAPVLANEVSRGVNLAENSQNGSNSPIADFITNQLTTDQAQASETTPNNRLPEIPDREIKIIRESSHTITAYNSEAAQTDDSPCITANGFNVCSHGAEDTIAANFLPFGTQVLIPELFGDRVFTVRDRMNKRHANRIDIWFKDRQTAVNFGVKIAKIQVIE